VQWALQAASLGAGELLVTSIDREGTGKGFELDLTRQIAEAVSIPVIACGGAGCVEHVAEVIEQGRADAVCLASLLHYRLARHYNTVTGTFEEGNLEYLKSRRGFSKIQDASIGDVKARLLELGISCRGAMALERVDV